MYFADFNNLKIITDYNYITKSMNLNFSNGMAFKDLGDDIENQLRSLNMQPTSLPVLYDFNVAATDTEGLEVDELVNLLTFIANLAVAKTLIFLENGKGYPRERRLDVPEKLKPLHASYGAIKRACNNAIITPVINIKVSFSGICYLFCMGREIDEVRKEFINE